jgi:hypothetical protein
MLVSNQRESKQKKSKVVEIPKKDEPKKTSISTNSESVDIRKTSWMTAEEVLQAKKRDQSV